MFIFFQLISNILIFLNNVVNKILVTFNHNIIPVIAIKTCNSIFSLLNLLQKTAEKSLFPQRYVSKN